MAKPQEALVQAIRCDNEEAVRYAIREGADVNLPDINGLPPLLLAYQLGQFSVARLLVENGADLQRGCPDGCTALMAMTKLGKTDEVEFLLKNKANPNSSDLRGTTPLHVAAMRLNIRLIAALMNAGGDPHVENQRGVTPISMAKRNGKKGLANVMESLWGRPVKDLARTVVRRRKAAGKRLGPITLDAGMNMAHATVHATGQSAMGQPTRRA